LRVTGYLVACLVQRISGVVSGGGGGLLGGSGVVGSHVGGRVELLDACGGLPALLAQRHYFRHQRGALRGEGVSVGLPGGCGGGKARLNNLEVRIRGLGC